MLGMILTFAGISKFASAIGIFIALYGSYACFFVYIKRSNRVKLGLPSMRARIGNLYADFRTTDLEGNVCKVEYYSLVFYMRRAIFVAISFGLFNYPGLQIMSMLQLSIAYIIYIGHVTFYQERVVKHLEIVNEAIGLSMGYCYLMLINIVSERIKRHWLGMVIVIAALMLICINFSLLGLTIYHKMKLRFVKTMNRQKHKKA